MNLRTLWVARGVRAALVVLFVYCSIAAAAWAQGKGETRAESLVERTNRGLVELVTGGGDGASVQMAQDLAGVINDGATRRLLPAIGNGSVQNLIDLKMLRGVDLAIVQSDVLEYARQNKLVPGIESITYIAKLHNQELHLLARADVRRIEDLAGKKVDFGGGAAVTGPVVFDLLHIKAEPIFDDHAVALAKLKAGEVSAVAYVAAKPTPLFDGLGGSDGLHFLSIPLKPELAAAYVPGQLTNHASRLAECCAAAPVPDPLARRMTIGTVALPPNMKRILAAWSVSCSMASTTKSLNCISPIGRIPVTAAPTQAPAMPASEMGVSITRSGPN